MIRYLFGIFTGVLAVAMLWVSTAPKSRPVPQMPVVGDWSIIKGKTAPIKPHKQLEVVIQDKTPNQIVRDVDATITMGGWHIVSKTRILPQNGGGWVIHLEPDSMPKEAR
jgi:hypothetical protein